MMGVKSFYDCKVTVSIDTVLFLIHQPLLKLKKVQEKEKNTMKMIRHLPYND